MEASKTIKLLEERLARAEAQLAETARLEAAARESNARHRLLIGTVAQAVWETDASGVVTTDSPSWRSYTGQTLDEWLGYGWLDAVHPDDRAFAERQWRAAMAACNFVNAEFRLRAPDGGWRWSNVRAAPVLDAAGRIEKWAGINIDIDARKRAEAALFESEAQYRLLFDGIADGFCVLEVLFDENDRPFDYSLTRTAEPIVVAVLINEAGEVQAVVEDFGNEQATIRLLADFAVPNDKAIEVWTLPSREMGPVSLGLLEGVHSARLDGPALPTPRDNQLYEITLEQAGGSPTGRPTGPILAKGLARFPR